MAKRTRVGIVVPSLGERNHYLEECLDSLAQENVAVFLIGPKGTLESHNTKGSYKVLDDKGLTLPEAINYAISMLPSNVDYVSWLGDDDSLVPGAVSKQLEVFETNPDVVATYGQCLYVDASGERLMLQKSGSFAARLVSWGPNLIPQPGGLFRRDAWEKIGGLDPKYSQAFDTDLFLRLKRIGTLRYVPRCLSRYRWHESALSVKNRWKSVRESSAARRQNSNSRLIANPLLELVVQLATMVAGKMFTFRLNNLRNRY